MSRALVVAIVVAVADRTRARPLPDLALEAFGPDRMMWGSDYPPVSGREGYASSLGVPLDYFGKLSESEHEWIFGKAALKIWRFND